MYSTTHTKYYVVEMRIVYIPTLSLSLQNDDDDDEGPQQPPVFDSLFYSTKKNSPQYCMYEYIYFPSVLFSLTFIISSK